MHYLYEIIVKNNNCMKKIQYILLASLAIGAGASAASLPEEAAAMAEQFLSQKAYTFEAFFSITQCSGSTGFCIFHSAKKRQLSIAILNANH